MKELTLCKILTIGNGNPLFIATNNVSKLYKEMDEMYEDRLKGFDKIKKIKIKEY